MSASRRITGLVATLAFALVLATSLETTGLGEVPLGDFSVTHAVAVQLAAGGPRYLALAAVAPRDVERARLLLLSPAALVTVGDGRSVATTSSWPADSVAPSTAP